jgi:hypothetical protein
MPSPERVYFWFGVLIASRGSGTASDGAFRDHAESVMTPHPLRCDARAITHPRRFEMALSDELAKVAARAKEAERRTAAAAQKGRTDLEQEVSSARAQADVHQSWTEHIAQAREDIDTKRAERDVQRPKKRDDDAERYAAFTSDLAYSAVVDAVLVRMDAEQVEDEQKTPSGATS